MTVKGANSGELIGNSPDKQLLAYQTTKISGSVRPRGPRLMSSLWLADLARGGAVSANVRCGRTAGGWRRRQSSIAD